LLGIFIPAFNNELPGFVAHNVSMTLSSQRTFWTVATQGCKNDCVIIANIRKGQFLRVNLFSYMKKENTIKLSQPLNPSYLDDQHSERVDVTLTCSRGRLKSEPFGVVKLWCQIAYACITLHRHTGCNSINIGSKTVVGDYCLVIFVEKNITLIM
jgi:hypothetical protein